LKILAILGGILAGTIVVLAGAAYYLLRPEAVSAQLTDAVQQATGYTLSIGGDARYTFWPEPAISFPKVSLEAEKTVAGGAPFSAEEVVVTTSYGALIRRDLTPKSVDIRGARFNLIVDSQGKANWPQKAIRLPAPLKIKEGTFVMLDERTASTFVASGINASVYTGESGEELQSYGELEWRKQPIRYTMQLKSVQRLMEDGSPLSMTANGPLVDFFFDGRAGLSRGLALAGQMSVNSDDFREMARWLGHDLGTERGFSSFTLSGAVDTFRTKSRFSRATLLLDDTTAKGTMTIDLAGRVPTIDGDLVADSIDLATYLGEGGKPAEDWSTEPWSFRGFKTFDAKLDLVAEQVSYGDVRFRNVRSRITQAGGTFRAAVPEITTFNGGASATVEIDADMSPPAFFIMFNGYGIDAQPFLRSVAGFGPLKGTANISAVLSGSGASPAELVSTLKGTASLTMTKGSFDTVNPGSLLNTVSTRIVEGWQQGEPAAFKELGASFVVQDGIASLSAMNYDDGSLRMTLTGEADLLRQVVDIRASPSLLSKSGQASHWPVPVAIAGPWDKPKIFPDIAGLPGNPDEGYRKLKTMGVPALQSVEQN
jgi:AsmA protein